MIGHAVGYGRTRAGDATGEYTLIFEHLHEAVGLRAAALALAIVQSAFAGTLGSIDHAVAELAALAATPGMPPLLQHVLCGITGGSHRDDTRNEMVRLGFTGPELIVDVAPSYLLQAGLPYSRSDIAIILDANLTDVPDRYQERERARRLVSIVADAVPEGGIVVVPAKEWEIQDQVRDARCRVAVFATDDDVTSKDKKVARVSATVEGRRIMIDDFDSCVEAGWIHDDAPIDSQVAATLAVFTLNELQPADAASVRGERAGAVSASGEPSRSGAAD
jgi:cyanophycin synthetase